MKRLVASLSILTLSAMPALAHPGHVLDHGQGHSHLAALAALGLALTGLAGLALQRLRARRTPAHD